MTFNFIEVCAGCGGLSTGLENAGFTPLLLLDNDKDCVKTLKKNKINVEIKLDTIKNLKLNEFNNKLDLLVGGLPCQSFSQAGKRKGLDDKRGELFFEFNRLINESNTKIFLIENVQGLITHDDGKTFDKIKKLLENNNKYKIYYKLLNANDYDVPQKRKRVFIIGIHSDYNKEYSFPIEQSYKPILQDVLLNCPESNGVSYSTNKKDILELIPQGGCWIDLPIELQKKYLGNSYESGGGKRGIARRLSMNEPSLTLTTSPCQKQTERCHPLETRPLTIREYARIQTFDDDYIFEGGVTSQYKQIGNAVPVKLAYHIGKSLKNFLESI